MGSIIFIQLCHSGLGCTWFYGSIDRDRSQSLQVQEKATGPFASEDAAGWLGLSRGQSPILKS